MSRTFHVLDIWGAVQIIQEIQEDEQALQRSGMQPAMLPGLVEHNPAIAIEVIANAEVVLSSLPHLAYSSQNTICLCGSRQHARRHPSSPSRPCKAVVWAVAVGIVCAACESLLLALQAGQCTRHCTAISVDQHSSRAECRCC